jgi:hypothetical protein
MTAKRICDRVALGPENSTLGCFMNQRRKMAMGWELLGFPALTAVSSTLTPVRPSRGA